MGPDDPAPAIVEARGADSPFLLVCDHAGRAIPRRLGRLGVHEADLETHIAWDIGALDVARRLAGALDACLIHQAYSRLVIDCNRDPGHPGSIAETSDGVAISGNLGLGPADRAARRIAIFAPYHARIGAEMDARAARGLKTLLVSMHSFTPEMRDGGPRPWSLGVLHGPRSPAADALLALLGGETGLMIGDNQPYAMDGTDFTLPNHAWTRGLDALELEIRQDLAGDPDRAGGIAALLARLLPRVLP